MFEVVPATVDLDPRWVKKVIANRQFDHARAYMDHVIDQAITIIKGRFVSALFTTPKLLEALAERIDLVKAGIKGVFCGGTTMDPQYVRFLTEEILEGQIGSHHLWKYPHGARSTPAFDTTG